MKHLLTPVLAFLFVSSLSAQNDTLLYENFDVDNTASYALFNSGNDITWVNFDSDGLPDANSRPQEWFWSDLGFATIDVNDGCLFSSSWLTGFLPGNRNYLITPPIYVSDATAVLSWTSAPRQTPLYLDGYSVLVSTTDNMEASFTDTLFRAAQYLTGSGNDFSTYTFSPGFVHGQDGTFIEFDADSSRFIGEQRPFSQSLSQYAGQTIYITFLHDADDDNLISLDDVLITGTLTSLNEVAVSSQIAVAPNPAKDKIEIAYFLNKTSPVKADIFDVSGKKVHAVNSGLQIAGAQKLAIDVSALPAGMYHAVVYASGASSKVRFVKE